MTKEEWLDTEPTIDEIIEIDGVLCISNLIIEELLDELTDKNWETINYTSKFVKDHNGNHFISASLELVVHYSGKTRRITGAVSFPLNYFPNNTHYDNTAKTLCISNAASDLGKRFGRGLNKVHPVVTSGKQYMGVSVQNTKMKPDADIMQEYIKAVTECNYEKISALEYIYEFPKNDLNQ